MSTACPTLGLDACTLHKIAQTYHFPIAFNWQCQLINISMAVKASTVYWHMGGGTSLVAGTTLHASFLVSSACMERKTKHKRTLSQVKPVTGIFACGFEDTQAVHPGLVVEGVGVVALPLQPEQAKLLQSCCQAAPFGRGEQTLWDPAVRRTWQLEPSRIGFNNPGK